MFSRLGQKRLHLELVVVADERERLDLRNLLARHDVRVEIRQFPGALLGFSVEDLGKIVGRRNGVRDVAVLAYRVASDAAAIRHNGFGLAAGGRYAGQQHCCRASAR